MKKAIIRLSVLALTLSSIAFVGCHHREISSEKKISWISEKIEDELDLNQEQKEKLQTLSQEVLGVMKAQEEQKKQGHEKLYQYLSQTTFTVEEIEKEYDKKETQIKLTFQKIAPHVVHFLNSLTPEQRKKAIEEIKTHLD